MKNIEYIIDHFDQKTKRNSFYDLKSIIELTSE